MKKIPILFTTYNRLEYTKISLMALLKTMPYAVLVFDNGSTDGTKEWLLSLKDKLELRGIKNILFHFNDTNIGVAGAMNHFLETFPDVEYIAKVDNDTVVYPGWTDLLQWVLYSNEADIVQAKHYVIPEVHHEGWKGLMKTCEEVQRGVWQADFVGGTGIVIRRSAIKSRIPETDWKLGGWNQWQIERSHVVKVFTEAVEIKLLDDHGYHDYPDYYRETGRL